MVSVSVLPPARDSGSIQPVWSAEETMSLRQPTPIQLLLPALVALAAWAAGAPAQILGEAPANASATAAEPSAAQQVALEEQKTVATIREAVEAAKYDEAIDLAKDFVRNAKTESLKTEATHLVAQAQRKKKNWDLAQAAYMSLRGRHEKGSEPYIRTSAIIEILRASRDGLYFPLVAANGGTAEDPGPAASKTLDKDEVVEEAMACLAKNETERLRVRVPRISGARTVPDLLSRFLPVAEELHRLRVIWPDLNPSLEREAVQMTAMRLQALSRQILASMKDRETAFKNQRRINTSQRRDMLRCRQTCEQMATAEDSFLKAVAQLGGTAGWAEGQKLCEDGAKRRDAFAELARTFGPPEKKQTGSRGGNYNWRRDSRDSGGTP